MYNFDLRQEASSQCVSPAPYLSSSFIIIALLLFFSSGCNGGDEIEDMQASLDMDAEISSPGAMRSSTGFSASEQPLNKPINEPDVVTDQERKLITDGRVSFEVSDLSETRERVVSAVDRYEAYISSDEEYNRDDQISISMVIRVPSRNFDALLNNVTGDIRHLDSKQINVRDVTEEFVDIQARLQSKKELEARYIELLEQARAVSDMLEIERQMEQLRSQIESIEGRLRYLQNQVTLSTLRLNFYERRPSDMRFGQQFIDGLRGGWNNLVFFFLFLLRLWPFILILTALIFAVRSWRKKRKSKKG
jgi:hypothetical protein